MKKSLMIWVVYKNPSDFPGMYVARKFMGGHGSNEYCADYRLSIVRDWIHLDSKRHEQGEPYRMARHPEDDPAIFETWV